MQTFDNPHKLTYEVIANRLSSPNSYMRLYSHTDYKTDGSGEIAATHNYVESDIDLLSVLQSPENDDDKWKIKIKKRNKLLAVVDFVYYSDTLTNTEREAGLIYIQSLKDIPQDFINPDDVIFPTPPTYLNDWVTL